MTVDEAKQWLDDMPTPIPYLQPLYDVYGSEPPFSIHVDSLADARAFSSDGVAYRAYVSRYPDICEALIESGFHDTEAEARHALQRILDDLVPLSLHVKRMEADAEGYQVMAELFEAVKAALQDGDSAALEVMEASWAESDDE